MNKFLDKLTLYELHRNPAKELEVVAGKTQRRNIFFAFRSRNNFEFSIIFIWDVFHIRQYTPIFHEQNFTPKKLRFDLKTEGYRFQFLRYFSL